MSEPFALSDAPLLVACLCAQWCGVCRDYAPLMKTTLAAFEAAGLVVKWVDIEDHDDVLGDLDVASFPTVLIARGSDALFFGAVTPHAQTLQRLVQGAVAGELAVLRVDDEVRALVARVQAFQSAPV